MPSSKATVDNEHWLLTPGPLTTASSVRAAMQRDWGSWDEDFRAMTRQLRHELLSILHEGNEENRGNSSYECIPMQGSGTFVVEAMLGTFLTPGSHSLVLINGAYGNRIAQTLKRINRSYTTLEKGDYLPPRGEEISEILQAQPDITHVIAVHCETSSGILNPLEEISEAVHRNGRRLLIDSMSAFGALPVTPDTVHFDALVSSANKCIEGVPGFGFVLARRKELESAKDNCHSLSLDLYDQWKTMETSGQWRYTPPTHAVAAFMEALRIHRSAGGVQARLERYTKNRDVLVSGMRQLGFETLLQGDWLSPIIVTFFCPADGKFEFQRFYDLMKTRGFIIYPGKLTVVESFRIGCIGDMNSEVMERVVSAAGESLKDMGVSTAAPPQTALDHRMDAQPVEA